MTAVLLAALALAATDPVLQDPPPAQAAKPAQAEAAVSEVVVNGTRDQVETSIDRRSYSVASDLQSQTGSVGDVLRNIPSVQVDLQGNLSLRGDTNVTVLVDGKPSSQFSGQSLAQVLQSMPAGEVDRIEVMTNPSAEFRADGSAGIINLVMKKAKGAGKTASVRVQAANNGRYAASATAGYNSDKLSTTADVAYRRDHSTLNGQYDQVLAGLANQDLTAGANISDFIQGHVGADYDLDAKTRLTASLRMMNFNSRQDSDDEFTQGGATPTAFDRMTDQHVLQDNGEASLILRHKYAEGNDWTLTATYNGNELLNRRIDTTDFSVGGTDGAVAVNRNNFNRHTYFMADYERPLPGMAKLKLGYDFDYNDQFVEHSGGTSSAGGPIAPDPSQTDNFSDDDTHHQIYATYERPFGRLDALVGVRAEVVNLALKQQIAGPPLGQNYTKVYPTLHLSYDLTAGRKLTASYSKRVLRPQPIDLDPFTYSQGPTALFEGNPNLKPQDTDSFELGFEQRKDTASLIGTLYYRQTNNAFSTVFTDLGNGVLKQQRQNVGHQRNGGFELAAANKLTPKITYNFSIDGYWTEVSAPNLGFTQTRSAITGFGRANVNWQVTPKDFLQLNLFANGKNLAPQGYTSPTYSGNVGYRHTINSKASFMIVAQDPFHTLKYISVLNSGGVSDHRVQVNNSRMISLAFVYNFSGKPQPTNFDFAPGGGAGGGP